MISHGKDIKIFTGNSNPALAQEICKIIGTKLGDSEVTHFADGEASVSLYETVRGSDVFLINSTCKPVNDSLMELLIMIDACKRASAGRVTAVVPYFGYARQDRKAKSRDPISAKLVANMITAAGADRVLTMDLHAAQIQGFFDIPVDHLYARPVLVPYLKKLIGDNGVVAVVIGEIRGSELHIDLWLMSCRVLKRDMEYAMLDTLVETAVSRGITKLVGYYYPTAKNGMVRELYADFGFAKTADNDGSTVWELETAGYTKKNRFITVNGGTI
mgnify:CR=1 FL=1